MRYSAARRREGKVPVTIKLSLGVGAIPNTLKTFAFASFLLLYYDRVLGMPAMWVSVALFIALLIDAITDPLVGSFSDHYRSKLGRRHPLMFAAVLPLGIFIFLLFSPPSDASHVQLFFWLLTFTIGTRVSMTFFEVPWSALYAEFTEDYVERSTLASFRVLVGALGGVFFAFSVYTLLFPSSDAFPTGQLNPAGYPKFALVLALSITVAALVTTFLTKSQIPYLLQPQVDTRFSFVHSLHEVRLALGNRDFRVLFIAVLLATVLGGTNGAFEIYMRTYFWGLSSEGLRWFSFGAIGAILVLPLIGPLQKKFDKKNMLLGAWLLLLIDGVVLVSLRFADLLPQNGDSMLLVLLVVNAVFRAGLAATMGIMFVSMLADVLDLQEFDTGRRQEGVFMSSVTFSGKATVGVGLLIVGLLLENVIGFPQVMAGPASSLDPDVVFKLGFIDSIVVPFGYLIPFALLARNYSVTREKHEEIQHALKRAREGDR